MKQVWDKKRPKDLGKPKSLSSAQKRSAMRAAKKAGRPYPNLIDNMRAAHREPEQKVMDPILEHHYRNIAEGKTVKNQDGSISTVYTMQVDINGVPTLIPSVWDGKILSERDATERALKSGVRWPTRETHEELRAYDVELHKEMTPTSAEQAQQVLKQYKQRSILSRDKK